MEVRTTKRTSSILAAGVALAVAGLAVCLAPRYASAQSYRSELYIGYQLPTNPDLSADAKRMESKCMSSRVVTDQSCAVGNNAECRKQSEIAFRTCIAGIEGVQFEVGVCRGDPGSCYWFAGYHVRHVSSARAVSDALNQRFHQIQSENTFAPTGLYVQISGSDCALTDGSGAEVSLGAYSSLQGKICAGTYDTIALLPINKGDYDGAIAEDREAIRLYPSYTYAHYYLGNALKHKGQLDAAFQEYRTAWKLAANDSSFSAKSKIKIQAAYHRLAKALGKE